MKTKKKEHSHAGRFTRGEKVGAKRSKRHARRHTTEGPPKEAVALEPEDVPVM